MTDHVDTDALRELAKISWSDIMSWCNDAVNGIESAANEVDRLRAQHVRAINQFNEACEQSDAKNVEIARLRAVIRNAPHGFSHEGRQCELLWSGRNAKCTCWKADVL